MNRTLVIAALLAFSGCVKSVVPCKCTEPGARGGPPSNTASVVFMHPGKTLGSVNVLDENGTPLTALDRGESTIIAVNPGRHVFFANMGGKAFAKDRTMNDMVELEVASGRTYYVTATSNPVALRTLTRASKEDRWSQRQSWLASTQAVHLARDEKASAYLGNTQLIVQSAHARFEKYDAAHRAEHIALVEDAD